MVPAGADRCIRVLILLPSFQRSGPVNRVLTLCKHLVAAGVVPDLLALSETRDEPIQTWFQDLGLNTRVASADKWNLRACFHALQSELMSDRYQALHAMGLRPDIFASFMRSRWQGIRILSTVGSTIAEDLAFGIGSLRGYAVARIWAAALARLDDVIALAPGIARHLAGLGVPVEKIITIPSGIDTENFRPPTDPERNQARVALRIPNGHLVIGHVGHLTKLKAVDLLLHALRSLPRHDWVFLSVGGGPDANALHALASDLGINDRVIWAGRHADVRPFLAAMDIFVLPSWTEGLPRALLEAAGTAIPSVATNIDGCRTILADDRWLFQPGDSAQLMARLTPLVMSDDVRKGAGKRLRETVEQRFCATATAKHYKALYARAGLNHDAGTLCLQDAEAPRGPS